MDVFSSLSTVADAAHRLSQIIRESPDGEEIILLEDDHPVAKLIPLRPERIRPRRNSGKDFIASIAEDFDATPEGFATYAP